MFVLTLNRALLKKTAATALCGAVLVGAVLVVNGLLDKNETTQTAAGVAAPTGKVESTDDMAAFFKTYGLEMDPATVAVDKVKIPRKWDESFTAFNAEIEKCGLSLQKYKGKNVEKWTMLCPSMSTGEQKSYGVLLVYKKQAIGAYVLQKPSGEVTALTTASATAAPLDEPADGFGDAAETGAPVDDAAETGAPVDGAALPEEEIPTAGVPDETVMPID